MASMNSWCYFFLVEIIMAKQKTKNIMNRFLQGWQQIFGGDRTIIFVLRSWIICQRTET